MPCRLRPEPGLASPERVPDVELPQLYSNALAFVYPSLYEGFWKSAGYRSDAVRRVCNLPPSAVREAGGEAVLYADSTAEMVQAMTAVLEQPELAAEYRTRALARAAGFSWERTARSTYEVYREAARRFGN